METGNSDGDWLVMLTPQLPQRHPFLFLARPQLWQSTKQHEFVGETGQRPSQLDTSQITSHIPK